MYLAVDADQDSRQQEQGDKMVHLVDCKDELNMAMLKVILIFRRRGLRKMQIDQKNVANAFSLTEIMLRAWSTKGN